MPEIPDPHRFEPDKNALTLWLYTRKADKSYGMNDTPGFFSTHEFPKDQGFFIAALVLEIVGVTLLIYNGFSLGDSLFALIATIGALGMFIGDLLLAYFLHRNHQRKCLARNEKKVSNNSGRNAIIEDELKSGKVADALIIIGILLIAIVKLLGIVLLGTFDHVAIYVALLIMFSFIVYVHVRHTGYFIYGWLTRKAFDKQLAQLNRGDAKFATNPKNPHTHYFESDVNLFDGVEGNAEIVANHNHKIVPAPRKEDMKHKYGYNIKSIGILTDRDVSSFTQRNSFNADQITVIARECLKLQIRQYDPVRFNQLIADDQSGSGTEARSWR